MSKLVSVSEVYREFIRLALADDFLIHEYAGPEDHSDTITGQGLHCLAYAAQAWHLFGNYGEKGSPLFAEHIRATPAGPVVEPPRRIFGYLPEDQREHLHGIWQLYKHNKGWELNEQMLKTSAYLKTRKRARWYNPNPKIAHEDMRAWIQEEQDKSSREFAKYMDEILAEGYRQTLISHIEKANPPEKPIIPATAFTEPKEQQS